jgi:Na+/H+ antiporter NhaD/arsenite permease-like protein
MASVGRIAAIAAGVVCPAAGAFASEAGAAASLGSRLGLAMGLPFVGVLLSIALLPLLAPRFWHHHFGKVSAFWGLALAVPFIASFGMEAVHAVLHVYIVDYVPFLILLWTLYTVSGGILVSGSLAGSPLVNAAMLLLGALLASWIGTTGAAMLLIRPFLRANAWREKRAHQVVFFIFLVCNVGGALTPLGDPPLFLGFLHGVPFFWTLKLAPPTAFLTALLLGVFLVFDTYWYRKEGPAPEAGGERLRAEGLHNFLFLAGVVGAVFASGVVKLGEVSILGVHRQTADLARDGVLVALGILSLKTTAETLRERNGFSWMPIREVAILFAAIFVTMIPVIEILKAGREGAFSFIIDAVRDPPHYYWAAGLMSSFLDNAPTYLVFFNTALGNFYPGAAEPQAVANLCGDGAVYLEAIALGAVYMGANTYIGNAPNFMVRSIAEESGVAMPTFFGYIFKYSLPILVPGLALVSWLFLR